MSRWSRAFTLAAGWLFVGLAALGVVLPLLPTTPFVLLAASCFVRSSPRARRWLAESRVFGPFLRDWEEHHGVRRSVKAVAVVSVLAAIGLTLLRDVHWVVRLLVVMLGLVGLFVVWRLPTVVPSRPCRPARPGPGPEAAAEE